MRRMDLVNMGGDKIKDFEIRDRGLFVWQFKTADSIDNPDSIEDSPLRCSQQPFSLIKTTKHRLH